ncbi:MAG: transcription elongation factor GreB [Gammaproteobacteria bacterium]|jgi:transcription elongation factor GreB|nr:transcription elongation factor GreB [Gammaproteobacteria bacterium]NBY24003.1 transcription elongation factor GreB [Gammaproteobacteria bacterium]NDE35698.1 transcription elongation factor GreB [Gammaproteobacteria bacterium]NDG88949.1 transcription elongation factor GreB [Gammaproteobacteria bacterium]
MSRWRPTPPRSSPYITLEGFNRLETELKGLWIRRGDVTHHLAAAAAEGDRSENAEYIYRKKELREIDRRIRYLQKRLPNLTVVNQTPDNQNKVFFGAWVSLENKAGDERTFKIVGADEIDTTRGHISIDAPLARALLKRELEDDVNVKTPSGDVSWFITDIRYEKERDH